ncbi:hypothetical protein [Actinoplanes sp. NPDC026623]|uniref:hypothetical protein n=1 Tax=Actinoplanes sp. NPDC026623 TaxID=3155610 RepID=UPI0033FD8BB1
MPISVARLRWVALTAAALLTAYGEFELATLVGFTPWLAWLLPIAMDVYAYCAFAARRRVDVLAALGLMIVCQALAHLLAAGIITPHWGLVVAVSAVAPIICWRVHHLGDHAPTRADLTSTPPAAAALPHAPQRQADKRTDSPAPTAAPARRRPIAETRQLAAQLTAAQPDITREGIAAELGITPRRLRAVLNAA